MSSFRTFKQLHIYSFWTRSSDQENTRFFELMIHWSYFPSQRLHFWKVESYTFLFKFHVKGSDLFIYILLALFTLLISLHIGVMYWVSLLCQIQWSLTDSDWPSFHWEYQALDYCSFIVLSWEKFVVFFGPFCLMYCISFYCCCSKFQITLWLVTAKIYFLTVLPVRSTEIQVSERMCFFLEILGENHVLAFFWFMSSSLIFKDNRVASSSVFLSLSVYVSHLSLPPSSYLLWFHLHIFYNFIFISSMISSSYLLWIFLCVELRTEY